MLKIVLKSTKRDPQVTYLALVLDDLVLSINTYVLRKVSGLTLAKLREHINTNGSYVVERN